MKFLFTTSLLFVIIHVQTAMEEEKMRIEELFPEYGLEDKTIEYKGIIREGKNDDGKSL